jgi:hypothetical protein
MERATASEVEERKGAVGIVTGNKVLHIPVDVTMVHVIMGKHFVIDRPVIEKIFNNGLIHSLVHRVSGLMLGTAQITVHAELGMSTNLGSTRR